jgi:hypothetical protein
MRILQQWRVALSTNVEPAYTVAITLESIKYCVAVCWGALAGHIRIVRATTHVLAV